MALNDDAASYEGYKQKVVEKLENVDAELKILKETGLTPTAYRTAEQ